MKLVWNPAARADIVSIAKYISNHDEAAAARLVERIQLYASRLVRHPHMHRPGRIKRTREAVVDRNYILIYKVTEDSVEIMSVIHTRRKYPPDPA